MRYLWLLCVMANSLFCSVFAEATSDLMELETIAIDTYTQTNISEETRNELTQWAIHELIEQNVQQENTSSRNKKALSVLGVTTAALTLALVIGEIIKTWS